MSASPTIEAELEASASLFMADKTLARAFAIGKAHGVLKASSMSMKVGGSRVVSLMEHMKLGLENTSNIIELCKNHKLNSPIVDGTLNEILLEVTKMVRRDHDFLQEHLKQLDEDNGAMVAILKDLQEKLAQQMEDAC